jgi:hypothetical protein
MARPDGDTVRRSGARSRTAEGATTNGQCDANGMKARLTRRKSINSQTVGLANSGLA